MKYIKAILLFAILIFFSSFISAWAEEIIITNADTIWNPDLTKASPDVIDSTDAPPQNLSEAAISQADSVWSSDLILVSSDIIDSTDAPPQILPEAYISHADTVWTFGLEKSDFEAPPKPEKWSFAIITDLHIGRGYPDYDSQGYEDGGDGEEYYLTERLNKVVNWINTNKTNIDCDGTKCPIKFLAVLGDVADTAEKSEFLKAKSILDKLNDPNSDGNTSDGIPYVPVFGNHDVWPYTDSGEASTTLGENYFDEVFWNENSTNMRLLRERLNFQRDNANPKYKNFALNYREMNFIGLDFDSRTHVPSPGLKTGVWPEAENWDETINWLKDCLEEHKECLKGYEENSNITFSHHPFVGDLAMGFSFGPSPLPNELEEIREIIENKNVLANFGGHIHGAYPFLLPFLSENFMNANEADYPSINTTRIITTEALMVGSNEKDEYLKEHNKGLIRIVKVKSANEIDYNTIEGKYNPETGEGKEFVALNPYVSFDFKILPGQIYPCVFFKAHIFSHREYSLLWEFGDGNTGSGKWEIHCYSPFQVPQTYNVKLTAIDKEMNETEYITREVEVKEGIIPKIIKISEEMKEKLELISTELGEKVTEFGRTMRDWVLIKVKHSLSTPVGLIDVHFEKATQDIDLSNMIADINLNTKKSILYMENWPAEVGERKILFIPKK